MADFNPDDVAEISARLQRAEIEETSSIVMYMEMPYTEATKLIEYYDAWIIDGDTTAWSKIAMFTESIMESLDQVLHDSGDD